MGAYENPPLITQPNYGEIFSRNAQNIMAIVQQRQEEQKQKNKEKEQKFLAASERKTDFSRRASNIKAGALTENVTQIGFDLTDKYYQNEDLFAKGEIDAEQYALNKSQYESVLNGISSTGATIRQFEETIKDLDLSSYQPNAEVFGLIEAYKQGKVDAEIIDGQIELKYEDPQGNIQSVDGSWLNNVKSWSVVEKFDSETVTNGLAKAVKDQLTQQVSKVVDTDTSRVTTTEQRYSEAYGTKEQRLNQLMQNSVVQNLDQEDLGSYYMDKIVPNMSSDVTSELNSILNSENYKGLSSDQKKQIIEDVNNGVWSNKDLDVNGKTVNSSSILMELSKRQLVKEALSKVPEPQVSKQVVVSEAKTEQKQLNKTNDYITKTPITKEQWDSVIKTGGNKSIANMSNLVSPYGFSVVGSPIASESGESEIGYNVKDNITNETIKIFKSDTPEQVRQKMANLRGIDLTPQLPIFER